MNQNSSLVKPVVTIHERERAKVLGMTGGRTSDRALNWFCHMRLRQLIDVEKTLTQATAADRAKVSRSAVSNIYKWASGAGSTTVAKLVPVLGFASRSQLIEAAERWWDSPAARDWALEWQQKMAVERARKENFGPPPKHKTG